jgi:hypothetical protein
MYSFRPVLVNPTYMKHVAANVAQLFNLEFSLQPLVFVLTLAR